MRKIIFTLLSVFFISSSIFAQQFSYDNLQIVGNATVGDWTSGSWSPDRAIEMTNEGNGIFTWTGVLIDNSRNDRRFKFLTNKEWSGSLTCAGPNHEVVTPSGTYNLTTTPSGDPAFQVATTGTYSVTVNLVSGTMTLAKVGDALFMIGAGCPVGWNLGEMPRKNALVDSGDGILRWTGELTVTTDDGFKFMVDPDEWNPAYVYAIGSDRKTIIVGEEYEIDLHGRDGDPVATDNKFMIGESGVYTIEVDLSRMVMKCIKEGAAAPRLYLIGDACTAGWDLDKAVEMTATGLDVFTWTGTLLSARSFKFLTDRIWENSYTVADPASSDVLIESVVPEAIRLRINGDDGNDNKFQVPVTGKWTIVVDLSAMKMTCTKEADMPPFAITELYLVGDASEAGWDPNTAIEMTATGDGVFTWTGQLFDYQGDNGNQGFKFLTGRVWENSLTVGNPQTCRQRINYGDEELLSVYINDGCDRRFQAEETKEYTITVNTNTMVMTITDPNVSVNKEINKLQNIVLVLNKTVKIQVDNTALIQTAGIYDITGKCLNFVSNVRGSIILAENLTNGVYIVKANINNDDIKQKMIIVGSR